MVLFWVAVIFLIASLVRGGKHGHVGCCGGGHGHDEGHADRKREDSALAILRERYAKGDISKEEFESKKKDLTA